MIDQYDAGFKAAQNNEPLYNNPNSYPTSSIEEFHSWFAGWCYGMKIKSEVENDY
jgi:hypothetical protein